MKIRAAKHGVIGQTRIRRDEITEIDDKDFNSNWMTQIGKPKEPEKKIEKKERTEVL